MPPPIASVSTLATRFSSSASLVEILAPPTIAMTGRFGASSARPSIVSSFSSERPAADGSCQAKASIEAWARCAQLNASSM